MTARRSNHEGSVYQRKDGSWCAALMINGTRRSVYGKSRRDVVAKLAALQQDVVKKGHMVQSSKITVAEYLAQWLETKETTLRPSTYATYTTLIRVHVLPTLGKVKLQNVQPIHLAKLYVERQRSGVGARRTEIIHRVLHVAFGEAVRWRIIPSSPAADVTPPKAQKAVQLVWTLEETQRFLQHTRHYQHVYDPLFVFLIGSGCRVGEALGLRWSEINFQKSTVNICRAVVHVNNKPVEGPPKTRHGYRTITVPAWTMEALQRRPQRFERVFVTTTGRTPTLDNLRRALIRTCKLADVPFIRQHALRHVHATLCIHARVSPKALQARLGHGSLDLSFNLYTHALQADDTQAADSLDEMLRPEE